MLFTLRTKTYHDALTFEVDIVVEGKIKKCNDSRVELDFLIKPKNFYY